MKLQKLTNFITTLLFVLLLAFTSTSFAQTNYYVSPGGADSNAGTSSSTWLTISHAIANVGVGDIINVAAGTYIETITITKGVTLQSTAGAASTTINGAITISANNVVIDGFTITNPSGKNAITSTDHSHITIKNNIIDDIGSSDGSPSGSNIGIVIVSSASAVDDIKIDNNTISNIVGGSGKSAAGIAIGWEAATNNVTNLLIQNNTISNITSNTTAWPNGHGAYGILLNVGASGGGEITSPQILNNTISNLEGLWAHGIGLEGKTPNALVQGNIIHDLTDHKTPSDAVAFQVESNTGAGSLTISQNNVYNVNLGVQNTTTDTVNAVDNYWGDATGPTVTSNPGGSGVAIKNTSGGFVIYSPWWSDLSHTSRAGIPNLSAPTNGLTGVAIQPTFIWTATSANYTLKISTYSDMTSPVVDSTGLTDTSATLTIGQKLLNNQLYYWQVTDANGNSSVVYHFTTNTITITPYYPVSGTVYTNSTMFTWFIGQAVGSMYFKVQLLTSTNTPTSWTGATEGTTGGLFYTFNLNQGTTYYWRVILYNNNNEVMGYSAVKHFITSGGASITVTPSYPTGGATVYTNPPTLYWYVNQYAPGVTYVVRYSTDSSVDGNGALNTSPDSLTATANLYAAFTSTLSAGTTYWWQVSARYDSSVGTWTTPTNFKTSGSGTPIIPTLLYPTGGVTVYTVSPTLYWYVNGNSSGLTFNVQTSTDGGSTWGGPSVNNTTTFYYALSGLTPGSTYQWRVQSDNNGSTTGGESSWSTPDSFTVSGGVTSSSAVATWPLNNPTMYTQKPTLYWYLNGSSVGVTGYDVKYSTTDQAGNWDTYHAAVSADTSSGHIQVSGVTTTYWTSTANLTYGQKYYWAVASWDGSTAGTYSTGSFTIVGGSSTGSVMLSTPIGGTTVYTKSPTLYWYFTGSTVGITGYDVEYSNDGGTTWTQKASALTSTATSVALSGLTPGATYTWKVRAYYSGTTYSSYSTAETFVVAPGATTIVPLVGGPNNVTINTSNAEVSWVLPTQSQGNLTYELVFADNAEMQNAKTITSNVPHSEVSNLQSNMNYFWKVRSKNNNGDYSSYSNIGAFKTNDKITSVEGKDEIIPTKFEVEQNYPNPFNPSTTIKFSLPQTEYVTIKVYNILGKEIAVLANGQFNAGGHSIIWNGKDSNGVNVASGIYLYRVVAGNNRITKKMLLLK